MSQRSNPPDPASPPTDDRLRLFAHDLNNPLTAIRLLAETLRDEVTDAQLRTDLCDILEAADVAGTLVEGLGAMVRNPHGEDCTRFPIDLGELLRNAVERPALRSHVTVAVPAGLTVQGDRAALRRAFTDVFVNARRLVDRGTPVTVSGAATERGVEIVVRHPGCEIPAAARHLMFEPQGPVELRRQRIPVLASGLWYAKQVFLQHDGDIAFSGEGKALDLVVRLGR